MDDVVVKVISAYGILSLLVIFLVILFIMWIIKKSVKNAIEEILDNDVYSKDLKYTIAEGVLLALEQYNNGNQKERPSE